MLTPAYFGGDIQAFLDGIRGRCGTLDGGSYQVTQTPRIGSDTTLYGPGTIFSRGSEDFPLLTNEPGARDIKIDGVTFEGDADLTPTGSMGLVGLVEFNGVNGLTLRDCKFRNRWRDLLILYSNDDVLIDGCRFSGWGRVRDGQWLGGSAIFCQSPNWNGRIVNSNFRDALGIGIWLPVTNRDGSPQPERAGECWAVIGNTICNVGEAGIVGAPDMSTIIGNTIKGVKLLEVSGHGMELHGTRYIVANNTISSCDNYDIFMSNSEGVVLEGNLLDGKGLAVAAFAANSGQGDRAPSKVTIANNQHIPSGTYAVEFHNMSGDPYNLMRDIEMTNCNCGGALTYVDDHVKGKRFIIDQAGNNR